MPHVTQISWEDVPHLTDAAKKQFIDSIPPHQRDARTKGLPLLGSGAIYPVPEDAILVDPFELPPYWPKAYGFDADWNNTAAVFGAWDRDSDVVYIYSEHYQGQQPPSVHADAIKRRGAWLIGAMDPSTNGKISPKDGARLSDEYRDLGLNLVEADNAVEAGIFACYQRMAAGRLKVFRTCRAWLSEYRIYQRDENGKIRKVRDHCLHPDTLVVTRGGKRRIADLVGTEGEVLTVGGRWTAYCNCRRTAEQQAVVRVRFDDGSSVVCTPDHRFLTADGWVRADDMTGRFCYDAVSQGIKAETCKLRLFQTRFRSLRAVVTIAAANISSAMANAFIGLFGKPSMGVPCRVASTSITLTGTSLITTPAILSFYRPPSTCRATILGMNEVSRQRRLKLRENGTVRMRGGPGIERITNVLQRSYTSAKVSPANIAARYLMPETTDATGSVRTTARLNRGGSRASIMFADRVLSAVWNFMQTVMRPSGHAAGHALVRCSDVQSAGQSDVYCLTVPETEAFAVENGAIVHNCMDATRYLIMTGMQHASIEPYEIEEMERQVMSRYGRNEVTGY